MPEPQPSADSDVASAGDDHRVLSLTDDDAEQLLRSLSSDTARSIVSRLYDDPATASELSEDVSTSLQNVRHHLEHLRDAGLVCVSDTRYSVKGQEMNVYAPAEDSLVVCVGSDADGERVRETLDLFGDVGLEE